MVDVPFPLSNNPGIKPQEGTGRLINVFVEPRGDGTPVWRRAPGASVFAREPSSGSANMDFDANARGGTFFSTFFELIGSSTFQYTAAESTKELVYPTGTESGDMVFLACAADIVTVDHTSPSGFTEMATTTSFMQSQLFWKVSTGETTANLPIGTTAASAAVVALMWSVRGVMSTAPIVDTATVSTGASGDPVPPNFTATTADCLMVNVSFQDDDNASAVAAPSTITIDAGSTFGMGGELFAVSTGGSGGAGATVMVGFRPLATTGAITASTWAVTGGDDEWASLSFTLRHD